MHANTLWLAIGAVILVLAIWRGLHTAGRARQLREAREAAAVAALESAQAEAQRKAAEKAAAREAAKIEARRVIAAESERVRALRIARNAEAERAAREAARRAVLEANEENAGHATRRALEQAARPAAQNLAPPASEAAILPGEVEEAPAPAVTAAPVVAKTPAETLILVTDDSKVVRLKTGRLLAQHGYRVVYAVDGTDGVRQVEAELPDLVVTDIEMPKMDGFGLFRTLRGNARTAHIPVIMISSADAAHREPALREGVSLVLGKPFPEEPLLEHIRSFRFPAAAQPDPADHRRDWSQTETGALA